MKIKLVKAYSTYTPGTVVDCDDDRAAQLIRDGIAEREHQTDVIETAAVEPVAERADVTPEGRDAVRYYRSLRRLTEPVVEPVSLAEAKRHIRVDTEADDRYIASLITAAREWCEEYMDETMVHTQYVMTLDSFPTQIDLPRPPMAPAGTCTAVNVTYTIENLTTATLSTTAYRVDRFSKPGVLRTPYNKAWPPHLMDFNAVTVTWWGGRGPDAGSVPQRVKNAILWLVGLWYERRQAADAATLSEIPFGVKALLDSAKWGSYR